MKLAHVLLLATVSFVAHAGFVIKEDKIKCFAEASEKVDSEPDEDLKDKISFTLTAVKGMADNLKSLTDAQIQRIVSLYFSETCGPLKNVFQ